MNLKVAVATGTTLLLLANGLTYAEPTSPAEIQQIAEDLPVLSPDLIWDRQLPGRRWGEPNRPNSYADVTAVVDLSGDGQPEIVAASQYGSGAHLALQVFAWDRQQVWIAFSHDSAKEPGLFGWFDADRDSRRELWIDTSDARGLFPGTPHGPFFRDRLVFRWENGTYRQTNHYRFATPFYHLNRYLYFASMKDWQSAAEHIESGVEIDRALATHLGLGPFSGGSDTPFVNGRMYFAKGDQDYFADFGRTGRLVRIGKGRRPSRR